MHFNLKRVAALFAIMFALHCSAEAETVFTPTIGQGPCQITSISGTTSTSVTVADITKCGITANGQQVAPWFAWNSPANTTGTYSSANVHRVNSSDTNGRCRVVAGLSGNTFTLKACDGTTDIATNGTYSKGGWIARGQFRTLNSNMFRASLLACLQDTSASGCMHSSRLEKQALDTITVPSLTAKHADNTGMWTLIAILKWYAEGKPASGTNYTNVRNGLLNSIAYMYPTAACDGTTNCGQPASSYADFVIEVYGNTIAACIALGMDALDAGEKQTLMDAVMGDKAWTLGGFNYSGTTLDYAPYRDMTGLTFSWPNGSSSTLTATAGNPVTAGVTIGDWVIMDPAGAFASIREVCGVTSTTITTCTPIYVGGGSGAIKVSRARNSSDLGLIGMGHFTYYSSLCGMPWPTSFPCPAYPPTSGSGNFEQYHNHVQGRVSFPLSIALAAAPYDERARWLVTVASFHWYHAFSGPVSNYAGLTHGDRSYTNGRMNPYVLGPVGFFRDSFTDAPILFANGDASFAQAHFEGFAISQLTNWLPGRNELAFQSGGEAGGSPCCATWAGTGWFFSYLWPDSQFNPWLKQFIMTDWNGGTMYTSALLASSGNGGLSQGDNIFTAIAGNSPATVAARSPNTSFYTDPTAEHDDCVARWGAGALYCQTDTYFFAASRSGTSAAGAWNASSLLLRFVMSGFGVWDHAGQVHAVGTTVAMNGKIIMGGDGPDGAFMSSTARGGNFVVGGDGNVKQGASVFLHGYATSKVMAASVDTTDQFTSNKTNVRRGAFHLKPTDTYGFLVEQDSFAAPSSTTASSRTHLFIGESCGTPSSTTCVTLDRAAKTASHLQTATNTAKVNIKWFGDCVVNTETNSNTNGSYTGQGGYSFRITADITGTSGACYKLSQFSASSGTTLPTIAEPSSASHKIIEVRDATNPVIFALAPLGTNNLTSCAAFTAGHTGNALFMCNGLAAGTYKVQVGGVDVSGCTGISVAARENTVQCDAVPAGLITVAADAGGGGGSAAAGSAVRGGVVRGGVVK